MSLAAKRNALSLCLAVWLLSGCAVRNLGPELQDGATAGAAFPSAIEAQARDEYRIGAFDTISIYVYQEPDLSFTAMQVDAAGRILLPLVGEVTASGKTVSDLSRELMALYGQGYLNRPQITVSVTNSTSQKVILQGEVKSPGVYQIRGAANLLEAISLAGGETNIAALDQIVILRTVDGREMGAIFDIASIRRREATNPAVYGNDIIVVGFSGLRGAYRDVLTAAPLYNVFRDLGQ